MRKNIVGSHASLCMPITTMQTGTSRHDSISSRKVTDNSPQALGLIENPLFERSGERNVPCGSQSAPVSRETSENHKEKRKSIMQKGLQRSKTVKEYIAKSTASFFGLDNETEHNSYQRWTERRRRLLSKRWGELKEESAESTGEAAAASSYPVVTQPAHSIPRVQSSVSRLQPLSTDEVDRSRKSSSSGSQSSMFQKHRRKDSVYRIMVDSFGFVTSAVVKRWSSGKFWPSHTCNQSSNNSYAASGNDSVFYDEQDNGLPSPQLFPDASQLVDDVFFEQPPSSASEAQPSAEKLLASRLYLTSAQGVDTVDMPRHLGRHSWHRPPPQVELPSSNIGLKRIWSKFLAPGFDNFNRRQYGMGFMGRAMNRRIRQERITTDVKQQLNDIDDHRPFFTCWVTTVQILVTVISLAVYGFGPFGIRKTQRSGEVMVTSLHLQEVDYFEPDNFWLGPRAADLVHLGAKFTPCMRKDKNIFDSINKDRDRERDTACCVRNDQSGCVQTSRDKCSLARGLQSGKIISTWKKWDIMRPGPPRWTSDPATKANDRTGTHRRLSGSVCGQDPRYCHEPASVYPYEWPDDITKWPVCRGVVPGHQAAEPHMSCEIVGRPCCIGVYGQCHITTKEYCDFVKGFFHEEAALCSQVSCLDDVCGMIPFHNPEVPDQFYRLWTSLFLHAGILHLLITVIIQHLIMADLEKLVGPVRIGLIYIMSGVGGNLASAIFVPYRAEVGPAGSQFGLLACLFVEVIHCWQMLKHPGMALLRLGGVALVLFLVGLLPWVDNYAHIFGFIFGFLLSYALLPFVSFGTYDRATKIILIWVCLIIVVVLFVGLLVLFYVHPIYECSFCKYLNCVPITTDFCENQDIVFKRPEY